MPAATRVQTGQPQLASNLAASALLLTLAAIAGPLVADSAVEQDDGVYRTTVSGYAFFKGPESAGIIESPDEAAGNGNNDN